MAAPAKPFRFQNQFALLTYSTHLNKEAYIEWLKEHVGIKNFPFIRLAHENGEDDPDNPYAHTHVAIDFGRKFETKNARRFDYNEIHCHIKPLPSRKALNDAKTYIAKEDPANADLLNEENKPSFVEQIWNCNDLIEALKLAKQPSDVQGIIAAYQHKPSQVQIPDEDIPNLDWHTNFQNERKNAPTSIQRRRVTWYYDPQGGCEKTKLARYLMITEPQKWMMAKDLGTSRDAATIIQHAIESGWNGHGMIIDLPRQSQDHQRIYSYIEEIKDGVVTSQKYMGKTTVFNQPHLIVFANWLPQVDMLSLDRWDIRMLEHDHTPGVETTPFRVQEKNLDAHNARELRKILTE